MSDQTVMDDDPPLSPLWVPEDHNYNSSSPSGSTSEEGTDLMTAAMGNEVTAQLVTAGPAGAAAAAAIVSPRKWRRAHSFETNPVVRKRLQTRLGRKLQLLMEEYVTRVGQQAVVLITTPGTSRLTYKVFGAQPLKDIIKDMRSNIMESLESTLSHQASFHVTTDPNLYELPPLTINGIPTSIDKMTQAHLRAFIPCMLKHSTTYGKPGWGKESKKPPWWPKTVPWANIRTDVRSKNEKLERSWTDALREIVINCYKYHDREDLLSAFKEEHEKENVAATVNMNDDDSSMTSEQPIVLHVTATPDDTFDTVADPSIPIITLHDDAQEMSPQSVDEDFGENQVLLSPEPEQAGKTEVLKVTFDTVQADPSIPIITLHDGAQEMSPQSIDEDSGKDQVLLSPEPEQAVKREVLKLTFDTVQADPNISIITLHDGAQEMSPQSVDEDSGEDQVLLSPEPEQGGKTEVLKVQTMTADGNLSQVFDLDPVTQVTLDSEGQIILVVPSSGSTYEAMVANGQYLHNNDGSLCVTTIVQEQNNGHNTTRTVTQFMVSQGSSADAPQALLLNNDTILTKAMEGVVDMETEEITDD